MSYENPTIDDRVSIGRYARTYLVDDGAMLQAFDHEVERAHPGADPLVKRALRLALEAEMRALDTDGRLAALERSVGGDA